MTWLEMILSSESDSPQNSRKIEESAALNHRSLNAEIVLRLEASTQLPARIAVSIEGGDVIIGKDDREKALLDIWRSISSERQRALIDILNLLLE